jgi:hypothetical protein
VAYDHLLMRALLLWLWTAFCAACWLAFMFVAAIGDRHWAFGCIGVLVLWVAVGVPLGGRYRA